MSIAQPGHASRSPLLKTSRFRCLQVRLLYEQCGHIETLVIHELPCAKSYRGWLPETSPYVQVKACPNMSRYLAMKKASCARCNVPAPAAKKGLFGGWGKTAAADVEREKKEREAWILPIRDIVRRRAEWLGEMGKQEERKRKKEEHVESLKNARDS